MPSNEFHPDWASPPGDTISDILGERHLSEVEFASQLGRSLDEARSLIRGRTSITIAIARQLETVLGASVEFWMSRDFQYQQDITRINHANEKWLSTLPLTDMIKFGWLSRPAPSEEIASCLRFFNVPSVAAWKDTYTSVLQLATLRTSAAFASKPASIAAWLRQGEIEAEATECEPWDPERFERSLSQIRSLTREKDPKKFLPQLKKVCAESGVAVISLRAPTGCRASGATRFLTSHKALLLLSFRHLSDDHFWFTFFHEAGHLLLHGEREVFLEGDDTPSNEREEEANKFAAGILVPPEFQSSFVNLRADARMVIRFAIRAGIAPGIIVGQLQHLGQLRHNQLNRLKRYYAWEE
jgi:plasmid maintenance system antidote protein VapI/Zn-dependent peptidase ImmA (M78 family)